MANGSNILSNILSAADMKVAIDHGAGKVIVFYLILHTQEYIV